MNNATFYRNILLCAVLLCGLARPVRAQTPDEKHEQNILRMRIIEASATPQDIYTFVRDRDRDHEDRFFAALRDAWPDITTGAARLQFTDQIANEQQGDSAYTIPPLQDDRDAINPRLLDILNLAAHDPDEYVQQVTLQEISRIAGRELTPNNYDKWFKAHGTIAPEIVARDGVTALVKQLAAARNAPPVAQMAIFNTLDFVFGNTPHWTGDNTRHLDIRLNKVRQQAGRAAGLLDLLADYLTPALMPALLTFDAQKPNTPANVRRTALSLLSFLPLEPATAARLESFVRHEFQARVVVPGALQTVSPSLLLCYRGDWIVPTLNRWIETDYLGPAGADLIAGLCECHDLRVVPILIALLNEIWEFDPRSIALRLPYIVPLPDKSLHDTAWWQDWWAAKPAMIPPEVSRQPLPKLLSTRDALLRQLTAFGDYLHYNVPARFVRLPHTEQWELLQTAWPRITGSDIKQQILNLCTGTTNTKFLESEASFGLPDYLFRLLAMGMTDPNVNVSQFASLRLASFTGLHFGQAKDAQAWIAREHNKPFADVFQDAITEVMTRLQTASDAERIALLQSLLHLTYLPGENVPIRYQLSNIYTVLFNRTYRALAEKAGLLERLAALLHLKTSPKVRSAALELLFIYRPNAAFLKQVEPAVQAAVQPLLDPAKPFDEHLLIALTLYKSRWASDMLLKIVPQRYGGADDDLLLYALEVESDPRSIPLVIALMNLPSAVSAQAYALNKMLNVQTAHPVDFWQTGRQWRTWWEANKSTFPEEVRILPYPQLQYYAAQVRTGAILAELSPVMLPGNDTRTYWRISSGRVLPSPAAPKNARNVNLSIPLPVPEAEKQSLLIVIAADGRNLEAQAAAWQKWDAQSAAGRFYILLLPPPAPASMPHNAPTSPAKTLPVGDDTQEFALSAAQEMLSKYPVAASRVYLLGMEKSGTAVYRCALSPQTVFRGFLAFDAPFHSAELPVLARARGRRLVLLHNTQAKTPPVFVLDAAQSAFAKHGAMVKRFDYAPKANTGLLLPNADALANALHWLNNAR